jgi:Ca-activated chloride channel family protein
MIHLAWPWMALLLPLPFLSLALSKPAEPGGATLFVPMAATLPNRSINIATPARRGRLVFAAIWLLLVAAAMRPQWLGEPQPVPTTGRRMMLAIDVSGSMATPDMAGNASRLRVVQSVAGRFIDGRRGDRVGLILFGTQPYLQAPLTADLATVHKFLNEAVVGVAGTQTAIGDAIGLAIKRLRAEGGSEHSSEADSKRNSERNADQTSQHDSAARQTILVLLTDGENDAGAMPPLEAAQLAAQAGLRIYTIGVGAAPDSGMFGMGGGNNDLDEDALKAIAKTTGGEYFRATDATALQAVYRQIDRLEPAAGTQLWLRPAEEWFTWPLAVALLLSVPAAWIGGRTWT